MKRFLACGLAALLLIVAAGAARAGEDAYRRARLAMVREQIQARGIHDPRVLAAMRQVPRHRFTPPGLAHLAYEDRPLPIGFGQTISQPYIVALMTQALGLKGGEKVLEIGTGSGYQAAVLALTAGEVYSVEINPALLEQARGRLAAYGNVHLRCADGFKGWPEKAPFDRIIVTCAPEAVPAPLLAQLAPGGRMVIPVGPRGRVQKLALLEKDSRGRIIRKSLGAVRFVPLVRE